MVSSVVLSVGIVDDDKEKKNQPDEWNDNSSILLPPVLLRLLKGLRLVWS